MASSTVNYGQGWYAHVEASVDPSRESCQGLPGNAVSFVGMTAEQEPQRWLMAGVPSVSPESTTYMNAGILYGEARSAYHRCDQALSDSEPNGFHPVVAVIMACSALEALTFELAWTARQTAGRSPDERFVALADMLELLEDARGTLDGKVQIAHFILCGRTLAVGEQPFDDLIFLQRFRNEIVHMKLDVPGKKRETFLAGLYSRGICKPLLPDEFPFLSWVERASTRALARWACGVVTRIVDVLAEATPQGESHITAQFVRSHLSRSTFPPLD